MSEVQVQAEVQTLPEGTAEFKFHFKTDTIRDDEGNEVGKGRKHPDIKAVLPMPSVDTVAEAIRTDSDVQGWVMGLIKSAVKKAAQGQINTWRTENGLDKDFPVTAFDLDALSLSQIAKAPEDDSLTEDDWKDFYATYTAVMTQAAKYEANRVKLHVTHFRSKLQRIKANKETLAKIKEVLNLFASHADEATMADALSCWKDLMNRCDKYLRAEVKVKDLAALM